MTPRASAKPSSADVDDLAALVRRAQPIARDLILNGLDDNPGLAYLVDFTVEGLVEELIGHQGPVVEFGEFGDENMTKYVQFLTGAYAIGIAVGILVRPEAFAKSAGTR